MYLINGPAVPTQGKLMRASLLHLSQAESNALPINVLLKLPLLNNLYKEARTETLEYMLFNSGSIHILLK